MQTLCLEVGQQGSHCAAVHALPLHQHEQLKQARNSMYPGYACMYWSADVPRACMHVPVSKVYPGYACTYVPVSSVPRVYVDVPVSKVHPGYTCNSQQSVHRVYMYQSAMCTQGTHVAVSKVYPGYTCSSQQSVPWVYMYQSAKCTQGIHVPVSKVYPGYTCMYWSTNVTRVYMYVPVGKVYPGYTCMCQAIFKIHSKE